MKWNEYTWYSKWASLVFFILVLPILTFYIGIQYELTKSSLPQKGEISPVSTLNTYSEENQTIQSQPLNNNSQVSSIEIPPLFSGLTWFISDLKQYKGSPYYLFYNDYDKNIALSGKIWNAEKIISKEAEGDVDNSFESYYDNELSKDGWEEDHLSLPNHQEVEGILGDSAVGHTWSYLKLQNGNVYVITLSSHIEPESWVDDPDGAGSYSCPCKQSFQVFVSDPVSIDEIIKN